MENGKNFPPDTIPRIEEEKRETGPPPEAPVPVPLTEAQRRFAAQYHALIYGFLLEKKLEIREYYDIAAIGYLHAVQRYFTEKSLHRYRFSTIAWRSMNSSLNMNDILSGTYKGNTYRIKVECYPNTPAIKVQLLPVNAGERITMTQNLGQPLPRYQAFLCDGMLEVDSTAFMDYMEENDLGYIVDYKRYDADVFTGVNRRTAAVFQFHSAALRRLNKVGCQRYEGDYTRLKQKHAERRARRMAG